MSCLITDFAHNLLPIALLIVGMKAATPKMIVVVIVGFLLSNLNCFNQVQPFEYRLIENLQKCQGVIILVESWLLKFNILQ